MTYKSYFYRLKEKLNFIFAKETKRNYNLFFIFHFLKSETNISINQKCSAVDHDSNPVSSIICQIIEFYEHNSAYLWITQLLEFSMPYFLSNSFVTNVKSKENPFPVFSHKLRKVSVSPPQRREMAWVFERGAQLLT